MIKPFLARAAIIAMAAGASAQGSAQQSPVEKGAKPEALPGLYGFTEGPCADRAGNVYFTDQPNDRIYRWTLDGKVSVFKEKAGRSNGMNFTRDGLLIACADEKNELWEISMDGRSRVIAAGFGGKALNGPNDVFVMPDGGMYLTDPLYERSYWKGTVARQDREEVYYLGPGARDLLRVTRDLVKPNGIIGTADGKTLYVADIRANKTWRYRIAQDRSLADKTLFCSLGSDGMTIDAEGNLYLTGKGVTIFDPRGNQIENIPIKENWTANVCFGGADRKWLFITASAHVYRIRMRVAGMHEIGK